MDDDHFCLSDVALFRDLTRREMAAMAAAAPMRKVPSGQIVYDPTRPVIGTYRMILARKASRFARVRVILSARDRPASTAPPTDCFRPRM